MRDEGGKDCNIIYPVWSCFPQPAYLSMLTTFKRKANETSTKVSRSAISLLTRLLAAFGFLEELF